MKSVKLNDVAYGVDDPPFAGFPFAFDTAAARQGAPGGGAPGGARGFSAVHRCTRRPLGDVLRVEVIGVLSPRGMKRTRAMREVASSTPRKAGDTVVRPLTVSSKHRKGSFPPQYSPSHPPHTLILGTQPSDNSLAHGQYFMTNENAFWHIVGDALGFRRGFFVKGRTEAPNSIRPHLLHEQVLDYHSALQRLTSSGYALWDFIASSERSGSLDSEIKNADLADVKDFVTSHPTIERICFATGEPRHARLA